MQDLGLVVLVGGSGSGKSSLAKALQERLLPQQWLHFSTDTILYCLPQSVLDKANLRNDWTSLDAGAISRSVHACVDALLAEHRVIFDCVVMTERGAGELLRAFQAHDPILIRLTCSWEETRRRTVARGDRTLEEAERGFKTSGLHLMADHVFDTTNRTAAELADSLVSSLAMPTAHNAWSQNLFWSDFAKSVGGVDQARFYEAFFFGDSEELAKELGELVLRGTKRATAGSVWSYEEEGKRLPAPGDLSIVTTWSGEPLCIIETESVDVVPFSEVTAEFAATEGEGDGSLSFWREAHRQYFTRECVKAGRQFAESMLVACERFKVVFQPKRNLGLTNEQD